MFFLKDQQLTDFNFVKQHINEVDWNYISIYQKLSEDFIVEFKNKVNWHLISNHQILSESFIKEFRDKVDWICISKYQSLSEDFIKEFKDKVDFKLILNSYKFNKSELKEIENITKINVKDYIKDNWLYKTKKWKLDYIKNNTKYEIVDDKYILAYKSTKNNGKSVYRSNIYQYKVGVIYESNCDCNTNNDNSFGLSAWTKEKALDYCDQ